jgi:hypothetical protein
MQVIAAFRTFVGGKREGLRRGSKFINEPDSWRIQL